MLAQAAQQATSGIDWGLVVSIIGLAVSVIMGLWIRSLDKGQQDQQTKLAKIDKLEEQLEAKADKMLEAKIEILESRLQLPIQKLETLMEQVQARLDAGNEHFSNVDEKCHQLELKMETKLATMRTDLIGRIAGRN